MTELHAFLAFALAASAIPRRGSIGARGTSPTRCSSGRSGRAVRAFRGGLRARRGAARRRDGGAQRRGGARVRARAVLLLAKGRDGRRRREDARGHGRAAPPDERD